ncbi:MAG: polysaccharide pyruvyl transferase family protein, partial [Sulfurimonadaceae bacterium]|nr:polysaccharide pyruvyl transferase family protein [Sulfurimonadaceae bacterium]
CIDNYKAIIHIFPQVSAELSHTGHNDIKISREIRDGFIGTKYEKYIYFYDEDWTPTQLKSLYSQMEFLIGTRLHSVIFTLSTSTPAINIAYHGTKSLGILSALTDYDKYVIDINDINFDKLLKTIKLIIKNKNLIIQKLKEDNIKIKSDLLIAMKDVY